MADNFVIRDTEEGNVRWIAEPRFLRRLRRLKSIWNAAVFLARGGRFKVFLDYSGIDPRIVHPVRLFIHHNGTVVDVERSRHAAVSSSLNKVARQAGLTLARDDEPGFRVRWAGSARKAAWEEAGFDVTHTPTEFIVAPKGVTHG